MKQKIKNSYKTRYKTCISYLSNIYIVKLYKINKMYFIDISHAQNVQSFRQNSGVKLFSSVFGTDTEDLKYCHSLNKNIGSVNIFRKTYF